MMSSARSVIASTGAAGIQSICRITLTLAQATPNQRPHGVPDQIAKAAKICTAPRISTNQPKVARSAKTYFASRMKKFALSIAAIP